jgi:predicted glycoside hydrolase/deacetylase ChbG (UPF0249 family)
MSTERYMNNHKHKPHLDVYSHVHTVPSVAAVGALASEVDLAMTRKAPEFPHEGPQSPMGKV